MIIRKYQSSDCNAMIALFHETIHTTNRKDYTLEQCEAWSDGYRDLEQWDRSFRAHTTLVAFQDRRIIAFGDIDSNGYLDRLFVHQDYQKQGVGTALCELLEECVEGDITTQASITAKPFFLQRGYRVRKEQEVIRQGVRLKKI